ncbi:MAGE-like protein 2 isoform X1 [Drosophila biarmipes]|uniref:MAGE-like protein 2 isoform X1 n=1 Tax=Drosophila biarmipes TaxID=125945 RepID=UPI0007E7646B|nr:MAGE-like protein 2 isoform X1 [Drosophila biarmipes]
MWAFWVGLSLAFTIFFITSIMVCIRRKQKAARNVGYTISEGGAPVVVTSATHTAPGGYPVTQLPPPGYPASNAYVAPVAYPAQPTGNVTVQMPMPMPQHIPQQMPMPGMQTHGVAYPQYPGAGAASMNPPPYDMAMANPGPSVMPSGYEKQAPYNPNFGQ